MLDSYFLAALFIGCTYEFFFIGYAYSLDIAYIRVS